MKVIFMLGTKSAVNAQRLKEQIDDVGIDAFGTVREMMDTVSQRNETFDRIVISTASMNDEKTMEVLHTFLKKLHPRATVVYIFKHGSGDEKLARRFNSIFNSPLYTDVAVQTNSISFLEEIAVGGIDTIRTKYSIRKDGEDASDTIEDSYPEEDESDLEKIKETSLNSPMMVLPQTLKYKKRTGLFGLKRLNKKEKAILNQNLKLVSDYMRYVLEIGDVRVKPKNTELPSRVRKSMSNPIEDYKMAKDSTEDSFKQNIEQNKNQGNYIPNTTFTQLELGYYGFSTKFKGRPMLFRTGISFSQVYK